MAITRLHPDYRFNHAAYQPAHLSPPELTAACHAARSRFNRLRGVIHRLSDLKTNLLTLELAFTICRYSLLFRKEVHKEHGLRFGLR